MSETEIISKLESIKAERSKVKGTKCEVYTRVTGFIRPVSQFNPGKKAEVKMRKMYKLNKCNCNK